MKRRNNTLAQDDFHLSYFAITDRGCKRSHNEDDFLTDDKILFFGVADGVGGLSGGEVASRMALLSFNSLFKETERQVAQSSIQLRIAEAIESTNNEVFQYSLEHHKRIATTLSLIVFEGNKLHIANVGDSRVYVWRQEKLCQLTTDHTIRQEMVEKGLIAEDTQINAEYDHIITRAIGAEAEIEADITSHAPENGDTYLICTDGITSMLSDNTIKMVLQNMTDTKQAGSDLLQKAKEAGGRDNITLILISYCHEQ